MAKLTREEALRRWNAALATKRAAVEKMQKSLEEDCIFAEAGIAKYPHNELMEYEDSLKVYRDLKNSFDTAIEKGRAEGWAEARAEGKAEAKFETARKMLADGMPMDIVMKYTGLSEDNLRKING